MFKVCESLEDVTDHNGNHIVISQKRLDEINKEYNNMRNGIINGTKMDKTKTKKITAFVSSDDKLFRNAQDMINYSTKNLNERFKKCSYCDGKGFYIKKEKVKNTKYVRYGIGDRASEYQTEPEYNINEVKQECSCLNGYVKMREVPITKIITVGTKWE